MRHLLLCMVCCAVCVLVHAQYIYVYRNDGAMATAHITPESHAIQHQAMGSNSAIVLPGGQRILLSGIDSCVVRATDIPTVHITFPGNDTLEWVADKENYIDAQVTIDGNGQAESVAEFAALAKGRGNSSWRFSKKPMRLKLPSKKSLFGMAKAKNYVFLANYIDPSHLRNTLAHWLARELGVPAACHTQACNVYVGGKYCGLYQVTEKIGINKASVDIDESTGMLFELSSEYDEPYKFRSALYHLPVMVKDPDLDEICADNPSLGTPDEYLLQWRADFNAMERRVIIENDLSGIDIASAVRYIMVFNVCKNNELVNPKSCYMHKAALGDSSQYRFGPAWDFDFCFNVRLCGDDAIANPAEGPIGLHPFFKAMTSCGAFKEAYAAEFDRFVSDIFPRMLQALDAEAANIEPAAIRDGYRWLLYDDYVWACHIPSVHHKAEVAQLRSWLLKRVAYLQQRMAQGDIF